MAQWVQTFHLATWFFTAKRQPHNTTSAAIWASIACDAAEVDKARTGVHAVLFDNIKPNPVLWNTYTDRISFGAFEFIEVSYVAGRAQTPAGAPLTTLWAHPTTTDEGLFTVL